jgi:HEAT repeat protein
VADSKQIENLVALLDSSEIDARVGAVGLLKELGASCLPVLLANVARSEASVASRVWSMMVIAHLGPSVAADARAMLVECLSSDHPTVRRAAVRTLSEFDDVAARPHLKSLLSDRTLDPSAWFDDDCTVGDAAKQALEVLDERRR